MSLIVTHLGGGQTTANLTLQHFGSILTGSGVLKPTSLTVSAQLAPDMTVQVSGSSNADRAVIITDSGDTYFIKNTANENVTILANSSGVTKTDAIVLYVDLLAGDPSNAGSPGAAKLIAVRHDEAGVGTGAPTDGEIDAATSNNPWLKLREVTVEHNTGEIEETDLAYEAEHALIDGTLLSTLPNDSVGDDQLDFANIAFANYDTSEVDTGFKWIDGKTIYAKTVSFGSLPNNTSKNTAHGITGLVNVIALTGVATSGSNYLSLPYSHPTNASSVSLAIVGGSIQIVTGQDRTSYANAYINILYTKT